jgi:hypothetical protein
MGEINELKQEGYLCKTCGCLMEDLIQEGSKTLKEAPGYPRECEDCNPKRKSLSTKLEG